MPESPSFDAAAAIARLGGDAGLFRRVAGILLSQQASLIRDVRSAAENQDAEALRRAAHALKGAVANFGAEHVQAAAHDLERRGETEQLTDMQADLATLETELARFTTELASYLEDAD